MHLKLAGVTRLSLHGRGPRDAYIFDPHRLALPCWALALEKRPPALLVTLDRHADLVPPSVPVPQDRSVHDLDELARWRLDERNVDHILAAMEAGLLTDALVVARSRLPGAWEGAQWTDSSARVHELCVVPTFERVVQGPERGWLQRALERADSVILDLDLDCFTSLSDADPSEVLAWPQSVIRSFLFPEGGAELWDQILAKTAVLTLAREPYHCGGLVAAGRLFEGLAQVLFVELLRADLP
jgi:hypothetical protein